MAKKTPSKQLNEGGEEQKTLTPNEILNSELQANKDSHYNFTETIPLPKISSGSLNVDLELGGFDPANGLIETLIGPILRDHEFLANPVLLWVHVGEELQELSANLAEERPNDHVQLLQHHLLLTPG